MKEMQTNTESEVKKNLTEEDLSLLHKMQEALRINPDMIRVSFEGPWADAFTKIIAETDWLSLKDLMYREKEREYHVEDAFIQIERYLDENEISLDDAAIEGFDVDYLAQLFEENHDCNIADNDLWQDLISQYIKANDMV